MKMKLIFSVFCFFGVLNIGFGQHLMVQSNGSVLYLFHTVSPKENWYSISRMYGINVKELVAANQTNLEMGLAITQKIKIPLTKTNLIQTAKINEKETMVPIHHLITVKEGLFRISQTFNKVPVERIKEWNQLASDDVKIGNEIIIGFIKINKDTIAVLPVNAKIITPDTVTKKTTTVNPSIKKPAQGVEPIKPTIKTDKPVIKPAETTVIPTMPGTEGAFLALFSNQTKGKVINNLSGSAGLFKSNSGWNDGKYYVLMNSLTPGTIIKVIALTNNRVVYAKVLGGIPPGKENEGLTIRISNSATAQLGMGEGFFDVKISW